MAHIPDSKLEKWLENYCLLLLYNFCLKNGSKFFFMVEDG